MGFVTIDFDNEDTFVQFLVATINAELYNELYVCPVVYANRGGGRTMVNYACDKSEKLSVTMDDNGTKLFTVSIPDANATLQKVSLVLKERGIDMRFASDSDPRYGGVIFIEVRMCE